MFSKSTLQLPFKIPFHYGWLVVFSGMLCIFAGLGLGRFALGMLLPSMASSLGLSYIQMGWISTANFLGYLFAVLLGGRMNRRFGARRSVFWALLVVGISMFLIGKASDFWVILLLYTATGIGSGGANIPMMAAITTWFSKTVRGKASGFVVVGSGFAILLSGQLIPALNAIYGEGGWRISWTLLSWITFVIGVVCYILIRDTPEELGLGPVGQRQQQPLFQINQQSPQGSSIVRMDGSVLLKVVHIGLLYLAFGLTYVVYATFIVTTLVQEHGYSERVAGTFWSWVGLLSLLSGPVFGTISDRFGRGKALALVFSIQTVSYLLAASMLPGVYLYLSVGLFGIVAWSVPSIIPPLIADHVGPERTASVFGWVTFALGMGQVVGPTLAGLIAEQTGSFSGSFYLAAMITAIGAGGAISLSRVSRQ